MSVDYTVGSTDASPSAVVETLRDSSNVTKKTHSYNIIGSNVAAGWINRNGDSCNYHANWKFTNGSGADITDLSLSPCRRRISHSLRK